MGEVCKIIIKLKKKISSNTTSSLFRFMETCIHVGKIEEEELDELNAFANTGVEVNPTKNDLIGLDGLDEIRCIIGKEKKYCFSIVVDAQDVNNPADLIPLLLLQREYAGLVYIGIDLDGYDAKEQQDVIFKFSDFLLFFENNGTKFSYHNLYFINEKSENRNEDSDGKGVVSYHYVSSNRVTALRYKSTRSNKSIDEAISKAISKASRYYQPLFHIDRTLFGRLFQNAPSGDSLEVSYVERSIAKLSASLDGIVRLNHYYSSLFEQWFFLAFYHSLSKNELKELDIEGLNATLHDYYIGIYELVQNIIFHTKQNEGWLYVMFCKKEDLSDDDGNHFGIEGPTEKVDRYLKVGVYDFNERGIVDTFCSNNHLTGVDLSQMINPSKMPEMNVAGDGKANALLLTYAAHLGIKMLVSSVIFHKGWFRVESSQNNKKHSISGSASYISEPTSINNVKGTHYELLLPVARFNRRSDYPMQSSSVSTFLEELLKHPAFVDAINISECVGDSRQADVLSSQDQWRFIEEIAEKVIEKYVERSNQTSSGICALNMDGVVFTNANQLLKLLAHIQLRLQAVDKLVLVNLSENIINHIIRAVAQAASARSTKQQPLWSNDHAVVIYGNSIGACILCGETISELNCVNFKLNQLYPGYPNSLLKSGASSNYDDTTLPEYMKSLAMPYECFVRINGTPLFLHQVKQELDSLLGDQAGGYCVKSFHSKLGSKLYMDYFYEADTMFQNGFFVDRFAYFIAKDILERRRTLDVNQKGKPMVIIGYLAYSEPLSRRVQYYVNKVASGCVSKVITAIEREGANDMAFHWQGIRKDFLSQFDDRYVYVLIVPISSTLSSNDKTISFFKKNTTHNSLLFPFQYSVLLIHDRDVTELATDIEKEWGISSITDTVVFAKYKDTKEVHYLIGKQSFWHNLVDNNTYPACFKDEIYLNRTKNASLNTRDFFGFPAAALPSKEEMLQELGFMYPEKDFDNIAKEYYGLTLRRLQEFSADIHIGHIEHHGNHHRYYFNTENYVGREDKKEFNKWIDYQKDRLDNLGALKGSCVIISPDVNQESSLVDRINEEIFEGRAFVVHIDVDSIEQNIGFKYSFLSQLANGGSKFFFVDHAILTGGTFNKTRLLLSFANKNKPFNFDGALTVVNRLSRNLFNRVKSEVGKYSLASYVWFSVLPSQNTHTDCSLCGLKNHYEYLGKCTVSRDVKNVCEKNTSKFVLSQLRYYDSIDPKKTYAFDTASDDRKKSRMIARYKLFYYISLLTDDEGKGISGIDAPSIESQNKTADKVTSFLHDEYNSIKDNTDEKISFLKAVTFPPLSQYVYIRKFAFETSLQELYDVLAKKDKTPDYTDFCLLKTLLKHLSYLSSNALVRKDVIMDAWQLCFKVLQNTEKAISNLSNKVIPDLFQPTFSEQCKQLFKQKNELKRFGTDLLFYIKNAIHIDEAKSFWLGELLRTGKEPDITQLLEMHPSEETAFADERNGNDVFAKFLDRLYYDNNAILRKTLNNFEKETKKNSTGLIRLFRKNEKELLPLDEFEKNVNTIVETLLDIIKDNYYYTWFRMYVTEDFVSKGQLIDMNKDGVPLVKKLIYLLYARQLLDGIDKGNKHEFSKDVDTLLKVARVVMDADDAFVSIKYNKQYKMLAQCGINEVKETSEPSYSDLMSELSKDIEHNSFLIVEDEKVFSKIPTANYKKGCFLPLFYKTPNHYTLELGAVVFLYDAEPLKFSIRKRECGRLLMLLSDELDRYIEHCSSEKSFELWYDQDETKRRYRKTNFTSNHRLQLGNWDFESLDIESFVKIHKGLFMMSNVVVSHVYSVISEKGRVDFESRKMSIRDIFSNKYIALLSKFNEERWGGTLERVNLENIDFDLKCNEVILQSLIIQCLENASGKYADRAKKISITFSPNGFAICNTIVNVAPKQLAHDRDVFYKKYDEKVLEDNIRLSHLSDYGMTLVSLKVYCESVGMTCRWEFSDGPAPFFNVEISVKK
jgi:hypothetical protein